MEQLDPAWRSITVNMLRDFLRQKQIENPGGDNNLSGLKKELVERVKAYGATPTSMLTGAAPGPARSHRSGKSSISIGTANGFQPIIGGDVRIYSKEESIAEYGNFRETMRGTWQKVESLLGRVRPKTPGVADVLRLFAAIADKFFSTVRVRTNNAISALKLNMEEITAVRIRSFLCHFLRSGLMITSLEHKWNWITEDNVDKYPLKEFKEIANVITCLPSSAPAGGVWKDPLSYAAAHKEIEQSISEGLSSITAARTVTLDDVVIRTKSKQATKEKVHCSYPSLQG